MLYFKKGKNATEAHNQRYFQCMKNVPWLIKSVKSGLRSLMLEISHWTTFHGPVEVDSDQIETLIERNQCYTTQEIANILKYSNQELKIICTSLVMFITLIFGFHMSLAKKKKENLLDPISNAIFYLNVMKTFQI